MQVDMVSDPGAPLSLFYWIFVATFFGMPLYFILLIVLQHILGYLLAIRFDEYYFRPPYFTAGEVGFYSVWPFNLMRYGTYIIYTGFPRLLHQRRFKGHVPPFTVSRLMKTACQLWFIGLIAGVLASVLMFSSMFIFMDFLNSVYF